MKKTYKIEHWNEQVEKWLVVEASEDVEFLREMLKENRRLYPNDQYRLVEVTTVERVIG